MKSLRLLFALCLLLLVGSVAHAIGPRVVVDDLTFRTYAAAYSGGYRDSSTFTMQGDLCEGPSLSEFDTTTWIDTRKWDWLTPAQANNTTTAYGFAQLMLQPSTSSATFSGIDSIFVAVDWSVDGVTSTGLAYATSACALPVTAGDRLLQYTITADADNKALPFAAPYLRFRFRADGNTAAVGLLRASISHWVHNQ